jgi:alpha-D-ribose 1-methylphosphonate 5-triphosphate synthase subunit PhnH
MSGFDPVFDAQRVFRRLLAATARPGIAESVRLAGIPALDAVLLTLLDQEVGCAVVGGALPESLLAASAARVAPLDEADFLVVRGGDSRGALLKAKRGDLEDPSTGATAIYAVERLWERASLRVRLSGPGVEGQRTLEIAGLAPDELDGIVATRTDYPVGIDVLVVEQAGSLLALPRSTRLERV